jgi:hypothetical protein
MSYSAWGNPAAVVVAHLGPVQHLDTPPAFSDSSTCPNCLMDAPLAGWFLGSHEASCRSLEDLIYKRSD